MSFFKNVLLAAARSTFLKKCEAKSEMDHENHERGTLKLAFSMQKHIQVRGKQFFCISLGECRAK